MRVLNKVNIFIFLILGNIVLLQKATALDFIFEIDAGVNILAENKKDIINEYDLERISSTTAISYNIKAGLQFFENYGLFLAYGYSKRPDYYFPLNASNNNSSYQLSQKNYSFGLDFVYYIWEYSNKFNIALSLGNRGALKTVQNTTIQRFSNSNAVSSFVTPTRTLTYHYLVAPEIKFFYRLAENSTIYFAFQYNLIAPEFEQYPIFLIGIDLHFSLLPENKINKQ